MGGEFSPPHQRNQRNQILFQYLRDKKKKRRRLRKKGGGGGENSPISPHLDPRLLYWLIPSELFKFNVTLKNLKAQKAKHMTMIT